MDGFALRCLAMALMLTDHIGAVFFPQLLILRLIGRWAFPLYAFLAADGAAHTHSGGRYVGRLLLAALVSEIPFRLAFSVPFSEFGCPSVLFTLAAGVSACLLFRYRKPGWAAAGSLVLLAAAQLLGTDYGAYGAALVLVFYLLRERPAGQAAAGSALTVGYSLLFRAPLQMFALPALTVGMFANGKRGRDARLWFYAFYPGHLLVLWGLRALIYGF